MLIRLTKRIFAIGASFKRNTLPIITKVMTVVAGGLSGIGITQTIALATLCTITVFKSAQIAPLRRKHTDSGQPFYPNLAFTLAHF